MYMKKNANWPKGSVYISHVLIEAKHSQSSDMEY